MSPPRSSTRGRVLTVLISGLLLLAGSAIGSYAANGGPVLLGKTNKATKTTTIKTTGSGAALSLKSKKNKAPLKVSNKVKIKKLNADLVDGLDSAALKTKSYVYTLSGTSASNIIRFNLPGLPAGRYMTNINVNAQLAGAPVFFGCLFDSGTPFANPRVPTLGITGGGGTWFASGGGYLDTTSLTFTLTCQSSDVGITVPLGVPPAPAQVVLTRVDDVTSTATSGARATSNKPGLGG